LKVEDHIFSGKGSHPIFRRAIVAVALSPRIHAVLNQSHRITRIVGAEPILLHVGQETQAARKKLEEAVSASNFRSQAPQLIIKSGHPIDILVEVARKQRADLIIAGAAKKETLWRHVLGSVAQQLAKQAPCSLLLMTDPQEVPLPAFKLHCAVEYDRAAQYAVEVALGLAQRTESGELVLTHSFRIAEWEGKGVQLPGAAEIRRIYRRQDARLKRFLAKYASSGIRFRAQCFHEQSLTATLSFAADVNANLFIVPGPRRQEGVWDRLLKDNLEHLFQILPGAILLARKPRYRVR
jgi:nucleotide-binding universal stress UspA family protein